MFVLVVTEELPEWEDAKSMGMSNGTIRLLNVSCCSITDLR